MAFLDELFGDGGAAATDRGQTLATYGKLSRNGDFLSGLGNQNLTQSGDYFQKIMSGDPSVVAPAATALNDQAQQQRNEIVMNGNRTGGNNAQIQQQSADVGGKIADLLFKGQQGAAQTLGQQGAQESGEGLQAANDLGSLSTSNRQLDASLHASKVAGFTQLAKLALFGA